MRHFADRLVEAIARKGTAACVGFDPLLEQIPEEVRRAARLDAVRAFEDFGREVFSIVAPRVAVVKINIAFFEVYGGRGVDAYFALVRAAHERDLIVIGDVKRGDIGHTSAAYARAHLGGPDAPDAVTVSPYFGIDGVRPFIDVAREEGRGLFVLVHTSNPSAGEVQHVRAGGGTVARHVASLVDRWGADHRGAAGLSLVGAVVAPEQVDEAKALRAAMPNCVFLVPGFGAQGRSVEQVAACFRPDGGGAIVNSSRGVIFAHQDARYRDRFGSDWRACIGAACADFVRELSAVRRPS